MHDRVSIFLVVLISSVLLSCQRGAPSSASNRSSVTADSKISLVSVDAAKIKQLTQNPSAKLTVMNVWASWCEPCREEFPDLLKFRKAWLAKGIQTHFLSADFAAEVPDVKKFLSEEKVDFETYIRQGEDQAFINGIDPNWSGALPTTFIFDPKGKLLYRIDGPISEGKLEERVQSLLSSNTDKSESDKKEK